MTLLITVIAAVVFTAVWYSTASKSQMKLGVLCWLYWGASLMWMVDAISEYLVAGAEFFHPTPAEMLNDAYLGFSVLALGGVIWIAYLLIRDPKKVVLRLVAPRDSSQLEPAGTSESHPTATSQLESVVAEKSIK